MASLGTVQFGSLRGIPSLLRPRVEIWEVPGLDGYGAQTLGQGDAKFDLVGWAYWTDNATADGHIVDCAGLQGSIVTMTDDWGNTFDNILITRADTTGLVKHPVIFQGNANAIRTEIRFEAVVSN